MKAPIKITLVLLATMLSCSTFASEIYKWTDADGNVHYGDRPTDPTSQRMAIQSRPTDPTRVAALSQARADTRSRRVAEATAAAGEGPSPQELAAAAAEKAQKCTDYRSRLVQMLQSRRLYREDENGERVYLNDDEMLSARERVQTQVEDYCSS